jgi:hypothetical protein
MIPDAGPEPAMTSNTVASEPPPLAPSRVRGPGTFAWIQAPLLSVAALLGAGGAPVRGYCAEPLTDVSVVQQTEGSRREALDREAPSRNCYFCPDSPVTRGQMAVFLARALGLGFPN